MARFLLLSTLSAQGGPCVYDQANKLLFFIGS